MNRDCGIFFDQMKEFLSEWVPMYSDALSTDNSIDSSDF
jgi:hypothetical protein